MIGQASKAQARYWIDGLRSRLRKPLLTIQGFDGASVPEFRPWAIAGHEEYTNYRRCYVDEYQRRTRLARELGETTGRIATDAYCIACGGPRKFWTDLAATELVSSAVPNWREGLICQECRLNSRMRASIHLLLWALGPKIRCSLYVTEQITALYRWVKLRFPAAVGSEYLPDGTRRGCYGQDGIRHEDLTALSFADATFDVVISLDVMEHIPDFHKAVSQCARVLKPGGKLLLSVPFHGGPRHLYRARAGDDGTIEHLLPPEYHGDPLNRQGCLCFHHFGWDLLDFLRSAGFSRATAFLIWSRELGYLAAEGDIILFIAVK